MNYNRVKIFSKLMWILYILIGFTAISYIIKIQHDKELPIVKDINTTQEVQIKDNDLNNNQNIVDKTSDIKNIEKDTKK